MIKKTNRRQKIPGTAIPGIFILRTFLREHTAILLMLLYYNYFDFASII